MSYFFTRAAFSFESFLACVSVSFFAFLSFSFALPLSIVFRCPPELVDVPSHFIIFFALRTNLFHLDRIYFSTFAIPLTMDRTSLAVCTTMYACKASLSAASMMCALVVAAASIALSRRRSAHFNAAALPARLIPRTALMSSLQL